MLKYIPEILTENAINDIHFKCIKFHHVLYVLDEGGKKLSHEKLVNQIAMNKNGTKLIAYFILN